MGSSTLLFTFPSRYSFTIGLVWYLALECGHPRFRREFAVSQPTQDTCAPTYQFRILDFHYLWSVIPNCSTIDKYLHPGPTTPRRNVVQALPFSLAAYSGNLIRFLFLWLLRCFSSPGDLRGEINRHSSDILLSLDYSIRIPSDQHFVGGPRRLSRPQRPSSSKQAKASAICVNLHDNNDLFSCQQLKMFWPLLTKIF